MPAKILYEVISQLFLRLRWDSTPPASHAEVISLLGVDYPRLKTGDDSELRLTRFVVPFPEQLDPQNRYAPDWFAARCTRLPGTKQTTPQAFGAATANNPDATTH